MACLVMVQVAANEVRGERAVSARAPSRCASRSVAVSPPPCRSSCARLGVCRRTRNRRWLSSEA